MIDVLKQDCTALGVSSWTSCCRRTTTAAWRWLQYR